MFVFTACLSIHQFPVVVHIFWRTLDAISWPLTIQTPCHQQILKMVFVNLNESVCLYFVNEVKIKGTKILVGVTFCD